MKRLLIALVLVLLAGEAHAQPYRFAVPEVDMTVRILTDASVQVDYLFTFENEQYAHEIDIVDVGMPNADYSILGMTASANGVPGLSIRKSTYVTPGVEIHLGQHTIYPGGGGTVGLQFEHPDLVFNDTTDDDLASFRITPTWFGDEYVTGNTDLKVAIVLPKGVSPDEVLHQGLREFKNKAVTDEGTVVLFHWPNTRFTHQHLVGISFPTRVMERVVRISKWELLVQAVEGNSGTRIWLFFTLLLLSGAIFFRFSGGTGIVLFIPLMAVLGWSSAGSAAFQILAVPAGGALLIANEVLLRRRRGRYLPPIAEIEGGGIKRGLTAPEAAVLLEEPLSKVLTLVLFGLLKKGVLAETSARPLIVELVGRYDMAKIAKKRRAYERRTRARANGIALRPYEEEFLELIEDATRGIPLKDLDFSAELKTLVTMTADRLSGFDLSDTQDYYRKIIERALKEAESSLDMEASGTEAMDRNLEWLLLDSGSDILFERTTYRPPWHRHHGHHHHHGGGGRVSVPDSGSGKADPGWSPSLGDAAGSFAGWAENTMGDLAGAILPAEVGAKTSGGFLDLSGADRVTGDILKAMAESSGSGGGGYSGGGGSSCACACAGCACACACAGGGR